METIKCEICGYKRPQIEMVPVEYDDNNYAVCVHCLEAEMYEREMVIPEQISNLIVRW